MGAGDETRTRDIQLGRLALYQLSYSRGRAFPDSIGRPSLGGLSLQPTACPGSLFCGPQPTWAEGHGVTTSIATQPARSATRV